MPDGQMLLSKFGGGDVDDVNLSTDDFEGRQAVEAYAERVTTGGWALVLVAEETIGWHNPDGPGVYKLKKQSAGWHGVAGGRDASPSYTNDLQAALDGAGVFLAANPVGGEADA